MSQKITKRVFTSKSRLFLVLACMILAISCGRETIGNNYILPKGSLSQEEQKKTLDPNNNYKTLFKKGDYGSKYFRIPALICTSNGTILAAADRRYEKTEDLGKGNRIDVIVRRSEDLGTTWSEPIAVAGIAQDIKSSYGDAFFINCHNGDVMRICNRTRSAGAKSER